MLVLFFSAISSCKSQIDALSPYNTDVIVLKTGNDYNVDLAVKTFVKNYPEVECKIFDIESTVSNIVFNPGFKALGSVIML